MTEEQRNERIHSILYSTDSREELAQRIVTLEDENAKLREFTKNAYRHICAQEGYLRGSGYDSFDYFDTVARELGIEVDE